MRSDLTNPEDHEVAAYSADLEAMIVERHRVDMVAPKRWEDTLESLISRLQDNLAGFRACGGYVETVGFGDGPSWDRPVVPKWRRLLAHAAVLNDGRPLGNPVCVECGRRFDLVDEDDASEWFCGHDCEVG